MRGETKARLLIIGNQKLIRAGLQRILVNHFDRNFKFHECSHDSAVATCREIQPEIVILDLDVSCGTGLELVSRLIGNLFRPKVIVIASKRALPFLDQLLEILAHATPTRAVGLLAVPSTFKRIDLIRGRTRKRGTLVNATMEQTTKIEARQGASA